MPSSLARAARCTFLILAAGGTVACSTAGGPSPAVHGSPPLQAAAEDERAIREIVQNETDAWNRGDAVGYSRDFARDGMFTNILGQSFAGYDAFVRQHDVIFRGLFRNTRLHQDIVVMRFPEPNLALVETLSSVTGLPQMPPGAAPDAKGRLRTRLLQVLVKRGGTWKIEAYHNVDVKRGIPVPEPIQE